MSDNKLKHLEFIQGVITRLGTNSFLVKGWSVTLVAAIFALASKDTKPVFAIVTYLPIVAFWVLDAFFLSQERRYRALFKEVAQKDASGIDFNMDASQFKGRKLTIESSAFSPTVLGFHGTLITVVSAIMFILPKLA